MNIREKYSFRFVLRRNNRGNKMNRRIQEVLNIEQIHFAFISRRYSSSIKRSQQLHFQQS